MSGAPSLSCRQQGRLSAWRRPRSPVPPLAHERVHRMASITEQRGAPSRPARQRIEVKQHPDETCLGGGDDPTHLRVPAGEGDERAFDRGPVGPVLAVPGVVVGPADEVQQPSTGYKLVHEMWALPNP